MEIITHINGHHNLMSTHPSTIQITKELHLSKNGDCIIGLSATLAANDLPRKFKNYLLNGGWFKLIIIQDNKQVISGKFKGHENLKLSHKTDMVFRTSSYIDTRTVGILGNLVANDIPRKFIIKNQSIKTQYKLVLKTIESVVP